MALLGSAGWHTHPAQIRQWQVVLQRDSPGASAVLAWPAREIVQNGVLLYFMELDLAFADLKWMVILELEDYEGMRIEWAGPDFGAREGQSIDRCGLNGGSGFRPRARTRKAEMCSGCFAITLGFSSREHLGS